MFMKDLLPIGSIVHVNNLGEYMIIGYLPSNYSSTFYDYVVCDYKGLKNDGDKLQKNKDYYYVKREDITNVLYIGFQNKEFSFLTKIVEDITNTIKSMDVSKIGEKDYHDICINLINKYSKGVSDNER